MSNYENLKVWHRAVDLAVSIYNLTRVNKLFQKDFGLRDQMRRSCVERPNYLLPEPQPVICHLDMSKPHNP